MNDRKSTYPKSDGDEENGLDRREKLAEFTPKWWQRFLTWGIGVALPGQEPLYRLSRLAYAAWAIVLFWGSVAGIFILAWLLSIGLPWMALAPLYGLLALMLTGLMRTIQSVTLHRGAHGQLGKRANKLIGEVAALSGMTAPFDDYVRDHLKGHHPGLGTEADPDGATIARLGYSPKTRSVKGYWLRLLRQAISPAFRFRFWVERFRANLSSRQPVWRRSLFLLRAAAPLSLALTLAFLLNAWWPILGWMMYAATLAFLTPFTMLLYALIKHEWFLPRADRQSHSDWYRRQTWAHLLLPRLPDAELRGWRRLAALAWFWSKFTANFFFVRIAVFGVLSDLQAHVIHHNNTFPEGYDYTVWPYELREVFAHPEWKAITRFDHGLIEALQRLFRRLANGQ
jgi:hypothetical protein